MPNMATRFSRGPPVYDQSRKLRSMVARSVRTCKVGCGHIFKHNGSMDGTLLSFAIKGLCFALGWKRSCWRKLIRDRFALAFGRAPWHCRGNRRTQSRWEH